MTRIDHRLCQDVAESAWPHTRSNRPRVRPKGGGHKTLHVMCLETKDPNSQKQGNVCERYSWTNRSLSLKLKLATGSALVRRERSQGPRSGGALYCNLRRLYIRTVEVTISIAHDSYRVSLAQQSFETPTLLRSQRRRILGAGGWQPKSLLNSIWQGKPACWGLPESNRGCPGPVTT